MGVINIKVTIDKAGNVVGTTVNGAASGGGQNAATASAGRQTGGSDSMDYQRQRANDQLFGMAGRAMGFGGKMFDNFANPFLSGGEQMSRTAIEAARASAAAIPNANAIGLIQGAKAAPTPQIAASMIEDARRWEKAGEVLGAAAAKGVEASLQKLMTVSGQANATVGGISAQYASAGVKLSDQQIDNMLKIETERQKRIYEAQARVAARSGNVSSDVVQDVQSGMQDAYEWARKQAESNKRGNIQAGGAGIHMGR